jgi:polyhydroxybutyrate depolymerase
VRTSLALTCVLATTAACDRPPNAPRPYPPQDVQADGTPAPPGETSTPGAGSPGCGKPARAGASPGQRVKAHGRDRAYTLVVPEGYAAQAPYPLVFVLHGGGGSSAAARSQTDLEKASGGRAIFVYPEAHGGTWDLDSPAAQSGDVALFDAILLVAHNTLCVDARRVFLTGFSNGGYMANQLACKRGDRIRGVVTHAAGGPYESHGSYDATGHLTCPGKAVASLVVHGNNDNVVAPSEGQKSLDHWSYANRCGGGTSGAWIPPCVALQGCFQPVGSCRIPGLGHGLWPQAGKATWLFFDALK